MMGGTWADSHVGIEDIRLYYFNSRSYLILILQEKKPGDRQGYSLKHKFLYKIINLNE